MDECTQICRKILANEKRKQIFSSLKISSKCIEFCIQNTINQANFGRFSSPCCLFSRSEMKHEQKNLFSTLIIYVKTFFSCSPWSFWLENEKGICINHLFYSQPINFVHFLAIHYLLRGFQKVKNLNIYKAIIFSQFNLKGNFFKLTIRIW